MNTIYVVFTMLCIIYVMYHVIKRIALMSSGTTLFVWRFLYISIPMWVLMVMADMLRDHNVEFRDMAGCFALALYMYATAPKWLVEIAEIAKKKDCFKCEY